MALITRQHISTVGAEAPAVGLWQQSPVPRAAVCPLSTCRRHCVILAAASCRTSPVETAGFQFHPQKAADPVCTAGSVARADEPRKQYQSRRTLFLQAFGVVTGEVVYSSLTGFQHTADAATWPWSKPAVQTPPLQGDCATCIGAVDETLASCGSITNCVSSFDDRPAFFYGPWEYPTALPAAISALEQQIQRTGGTVREVQQKYVYATFTDDNGVVDDVEWLFSDAASDRIVQIHAASRAREEADAGRNITALEKIRAGLRWEKVPILRNRIRKLFFIESPWDTLGPEPPPGGYDYDSGFD